MIAAGAFMVIASAFLYDKHANQIKYFDIYLFFWRILKVMYHLGHKLMSNLALQLGEIHYKVIPRFLKSKHESKAFKNLKI